MPTSQVIHMDRTVPDRETSPAEQDHPPGYTYPPNERADSAPLNSNAVRRFREELRLNRKEFASLVGVSPATLRVWELRNNSRPSGPTLLRLIDLAERNEYPLSVADVYADVEFDKGKRKA
jgi:DNA-binding transcriptional regulator YiaG